MIGTSTMACKSMHDPAALPAGCADSALDSLVRFIQVMFSKEKLKPLLTIILKRM